MECEWIIDLVAKTPHQLSEGSYAPDIRTISSINYQPTASRMPLRVGREVRWRVRDRNVINLGFRLSSCQTAHSSRLGCSVGSQSHGRISWPGLKTIVGCSQLRSGLTLGCTTCRNLFVPPIILRERNPRVRCADEAASYK